MTDSYTMLAESNTVPVGDSIADTEIVPPFTTTL